MMRWLVALSIACGPATVQLPSQGGAPWLEVSSEHFVMWTDASLDRARSLANEMEQHRQIVVRAMNNATTQRKTFVLAFRSDAELRGYVTWFVGKAFSSGPLLEPMIVLSAQANDDRDEIFTHELTHVISFSIIHHQPPWLAEGIATFFEGAQSHGGRVNIGMPRRDYVELLRQHQLTPSAEMLSCRSEKCIDHRFYATTWVMFTYLLNEHPDQLGRYLQRLNELPYRRAGDAWAEVFPDLTPEAFDHALANWLAFGSARLPKFDIELRDWPTTVRQLSDADVLALRALATTMLGHDKAKAEAAAAAAVAADRTNLTAELVEFAVDKKIAPDDARAAAAAHPDDWRAWLLVAYATQPTPESKDALDKGCALAKQDPGVETPEGLCP